jgi:LysR family transcriptional regulator, transcriptional activator of nhaA
MEWLNYHHLHYFWMVAKEGNLTRASKTLRLAPQTVSGQIHRLEFVLGEKLFGHEGRRLFLTDAGRVAFGYADKIFGLGSEFLDTIKGRSATEPSQLVVGFAEGLPKSIVRRMLKPALELDQPVQILCHEARTSDAFMVDGAAQPVDVVLSDAPAPSGTGIPVCEHLLGECGTAFFAPRGSARALRRHFPKSLTGAPFLLPGHNAALRGTLEKWFEAEQLQPTHAAEVDDPSLMRELGENGLGVFAVPDVLEEEIQARYRVSLIGRAPQLRQQFYAISIERKAKHPAVVAICDASREKLFDQGSGGPLPMQRERFPHLERLASIEAKGSE